MKTLLSIMAVGLALGFSQSAMCLGKSAPTPEEKAANESLEKFRDGVFKKALEERGIKDVVLKWDDSFVKLCAEDKELANGFLNWVKQSVPALLTTKLTNPVRQEKLKAIKTVELSEDWALVPRISSMTSELTLRIDSDGDLKDLEDMSMEEFAEAVAPSVSTASTTMPSGSSRHYLE